MVNDCRGWGRRWSFPFLSKNKGPVTSALWSWMWGGAYTCEMLDSCFSCESIRSTFLAILMTEQKNTNSRRKSIVLHWIREDLFQLEGCRDQRAARTVQQTRGTVRHLVAYENTVCLHHPVGCFWLPRFWCGDSPVLGCMCEQTDVEKPPRFFGVQGCRGLKNHLVITGALQQQSNGCTKFHKN